MSTGEESPGRPAGPATSWSWPQTPLSNRYNATVTEVMDLAADGRRVAVVEGGLFPPVGTEITVYEDAEHVRRGRVARLEVRLGFRGAAKVLVWAELVRDPA